MFKERTDLDVYLAKLRSKDGNNLKEIYDELEEKYNIPIYLSASIMTGNREFGEINDVLAFCILNVLKPNMVSHYFTDSEIADYSRAKFKYKKEKLPIVFDNMAMVKENQWVGHSTIQQLMHLKDSAMINYNPETQRPLRRFVNGNDELFRISVNWTAVSEIEQLVREGNYVPDDITLNMPIDETTFTYKNNEIRISDVEKLDIIDGYHRYLAFARIYNGNPEFDYDIELRITNFTTQEAQQYIWQKDQKTKMSKVDSDSFNQYNPANIICERLNRDILFDLRSCIGRNEGLIKFQQLSTLVDHFWLKKYTKVEAKRKIGPIVNEIRDKLNVITSQDETYLTEKYGNKKLYVVMYVISKGLPGNKLIDAVRYLVPLVENFDDSLFSYERNGVRTKLINETNKVFEEWRSENVL